MPIPGRQISPMVIAKHVILSAAKNLPSLVFYAGADVLPLRYPHAQIARGWSNAAIDPSSTWRPPQDDSLCRYLADRFRQWSLQSMSF